MFPLYTKTFPKTATELERLLNETFGRLFSGSSDPVSVRATTYPDLAELRISLDGATLRRDPPRPPVVRGESTPALSLESLEIRGSGVNLGPGSLDLKLAARDVRLGQARDAADQVVLVLRSAADGEVEISAAKDALEDAIAQVAKEEAGKHGVTIDQVRLTVLQRGARGLDADVQLRARKLFFTTVIRVSAKLDLGEQLNASLSAVRCTGEGAIGSLACGFLAPHLQKVDGRTISLMALPLGDIRLRDVRISANERLTVRAEFGA
jgi:hypothetical protein